MPWWSPKRLLVTLTPAGTLLVANDIAADDPEFSRFNLILCNSPIITLSTISMVLQLVAYLGLFEWLAAGKYLSADIMTLLTTQLLPLVVVYNAMVNFPNVLRQSCLVVVSTYCHYYGDIPERDVFFQVKFRVSFFAFPGEAFRDEDRSHFLDLFLHACQSLKYP